MIHYLAILWRILILPGFLFLLIYGFLLEFVDRKLYARMQNRIGPPWYQPVADILKLIGKKTIIPSDADEVMFRNMPIASLAAVSTAFLYVPVLGGNAAFSFSGDLIIVLYFLAIPTLAMFLAGWYSRGVFATLGATRVLTQMFVYEVPLFIALLAPTLLANSWSINEIAAYYAAHPLYAFINIPSMLVALVAFQCKLERAPFDSPEAETEIVSGALVEYGGRLLAYFRVAANAELVLILSVFAAIFLPFMSGVWWLDAILYFVKTGLGLFLLTLMRATMARLVISEIVRFCWKYLTPIAMAQIVLNFVLRGVL